MRRLPPGVLVLALLCRGMAVAQEKEPIVLGLHADMSSGSALAGEAILRGVQLAISEIVDLRVVQTFSFIGNPGEAQSPSDYKLATFNPRGVLVLAQP